MVKPRCANGECARESRPKKCARWELCGKCFKELEGKVRVPGKTQGRWAVACTNWNTAVGKLMGCKGAAGPEREGGLKMCGVCFRNSGQNSLKAKLAATKMDWRKRKKMEEESSVPASVDLHVITVRGNFARLRALAEITSRERPMKSTPCSKVCKHTRGMCSACMHQSPSDCAVCVGLYILGVCVHCGGGHPCTDIRHT